MSAPKNESDLRARGFVNRPDGVWVRPKKQNPNVVLEPKAKYAKSNQAGGSSPCAKPEQAVRHDPLAAVQREEGHSSRFQVCITSFRRRLLDPDNLAGGCKYFVDCCRYGKLIPDDRPQDIELITRQVKVKSKEQEQTVIEIERLI